MCSSTCDYIQIFYFRDGHVTIFGTLQGPISAKCLVVDSRLAKGTATVSAFHRYHWFGVKLFPV